MLKFPNAKLNLGLRILNKRPDGFHNIESVFYPVNYCDALEILPSDNFSFETSGHTLPPNSWDNLCVKAYDLLKVDFDMPPVNIFLYKNISIGAGLGGGSSDAAFTLKMLNEMFNLKLSEIQLEGYAVQLGSDCGFFIKNKPALVTGRGEELRTIELNLSKHSIAIINPAVTVNTAFAYKLWDEKFGSKQRDETIALAQLVKLPLIEWKSNIENDFEKVIFNGFPGLKTIKSILYNEGAHYASLSGSGSSLFGIFERGFKIENLTRKFINEGVDANLFSVNK